MSAKADHESRKGGFAHTASHDQHPHRKGKLAKPTPHDPKKAARIQAMRNRNSSC